MTRVLMTGAAGFIGRHILSELLKRDVEVVAVLRSNVAAPSGLFRIIRTDDLFRESEAFWAEAFVNIDIVLHVAWYAQPGDYVNSPKNLTCMSGTLRMAETAAKAAVKKVVGIGTCFEYDLDAGYLKTSTPLRPRSAYAAAKAGTYLALSQTLPRLGISFAWCRLFYLYGEGEDDRRLVPYLRSRLAAGEVAELTSGRQIRDFLEVSEAARQVTAVTLSEDEGVYNICSGKPVTVADLAQSIAKEYGRPDLLKFGARPDNAEDPLCVLGEPSKIA
jgi:dTDP-6-deoxy-L-talose 4-dehydrogenase (NAD+)